MKIKKYIGNLWYLLIYRFIRPRIIVTQASFSGDGNFIDIRYWLSRPDKMNHKAFPYLVTVQNQKLGLMHFSKFGIMKSKIRKHTNTGILLFYNKNREVSKGDRVTLFWGGLVTREIIVK